MYSNAPEDDKTAAMSLVRRYESSISLSCCYPESHISVSSSSNLWIMVRRLYTNFYVEMDSDVFESEHRQIDLDLATLLQRHLEEMDDLDPNLLSSRHNAPLSKTCTN